MIPIVGEAHKYKKNKAKKQVVNYLGDILAELSKDISPQIENLQDSISSQIKELKDKESQISTEITHDVLFALPEVIDRYKDEKDTKGLSSAVSQLVREKTSKAIEVELSRYVKEIGTALATLQNVDVGEFEDRYIEIEQVAGKTKKAATSAAGGAGGAYGGGLAGAEIGTLICPGPGTLIGGFIGSIIGGICGALIGEAGGEYFVETYTVKETIGVSIEKVQAKTEQSIKKAIPLMVTPIIDKCIEGIKPVEQYMFHIRKSITTFEEKVTKLQESV